MGAGHGDRIQIRGDLFPIEFSSLLSGTVVFEVAMKRLLPLFGRILVKDIKYIAPAVETTIDGIILPEKDTYDSARLGEVVAVSPNLECCEDPCYLVPGAIVMIPEFGGARFNYEGDNLEIYRCEDIIGVVKPEEQL